MVAEFTSTETTFQQHNVAFVDISGATTVDRKERFLSLFILPVASFDLNKFGARLVVSNC